MGACAGNKDNKGAAARKPPILNPLRLNVLINHGSNPSHAASEPPPAYAASDPHAATKVLTDDSTHASNISVVVSAGDTVVQLQRAVTVPP